MILTLFDRTSDPGTPLMVPKVLLHDHLDGGLRPRTMAELAVTVGYDQLPADIDSVERFFNDRVVDSLEEYLAPFEHTVAVMQTVGSLRRVAMESVIDHAASGVVYAELRMAPSLHTQRGLNRTEVIEATLEGLEMGEAATGTTARLIACAMRQDDDAIEVVDAAAQFIGSGVVGFDLAGPEAGFPPSRHRAALEAAIQAGLRLTIHAGEGDGITSINDALDCGAERLGHGVRIVEDIKAHNGDVALGETAQRVLNQRIALEICPKSEIDTRTVGAAAAHPIDLLHRAGFATTINTDNTLMSSTDMSREFDLLSSHKGFALEDFRSITMQAVDAAFCDEETKAHVQDVVDRGYKELS